MISLEYVKLAEVGYKGFLLLVTGALVVIFFGLWIAYVAILNDSEQQAIDDIYEYELSLIRKGTDKQETHSRGGLQFERLIEKRPLIETKGQIGVLFAIFIVWVLSILGFKPVRKVAEDVGLIAAYREYVEAQVQAREQKVEYERRYGSGRILGWEYDCSFHQDEPSQYEDVVKLDIDVAKSDRPVLKAVFLECRTDDRPPRMYSYDDGATARLHVPLKPEQFAKRLAMLRSENDVFVSWELAWDKDGPAPYDFSARDRLCTSVALISAAGSCTTKRKEDLLETKAKSAREESDPTETGAETDPTEGESPSVVEETGYRDGSAKVARWRYQMTVAAESLGQNQESLLVDLEDASGDMPLPNRIRLSSIERDPIYRYGTLHLSLSLNELQRIRALLMDMPDRFRVSWELSVDGHDPGKPDVLRLRSNGTYVTFG